MSSAADEETILTRERLRLLAWGYYIHGGFSALMMSFLLIPFLFMMIAVAAIPESKSSKPSPPPSTGLSSLASPAPHPSPTQEPPPKFIFGIFAALFGTIILGNFIVSAAHGLRWAQHTEACKQDIDLRDGYR